MTTEVAPGRAEQPKSTRWVLAGAFVLALGGAIVFVRGRKLSANGTPPVESAALALPAAVVVARASNRDGPVFPDGLGGAVLLLTVTVRPNVDGPRTAISF